MFRGVTRPFAFLALGLAFLAACGSAAGDDDGGTAGGAAGAGGEAGSTAAGSAGSGTAGVGGGASGQGGSFVTQGGAAGTGSNECAGVQAEAEVWGHSADTLFRVDPNAKTVTTVGKFKGCPGSIIDIALDKSGAMVGTTFNALVKIDKKTAQCTMVASGSYPNSLSYVPAGTALPNEEALVGYVGGDYVLINPTTGAVTTKGSLPSGYQSSGDIVSVIGGKTYLTVKGSTCADCIVEVDPKNGGFASGAKPQKLQFGSVFGLAFWAGAAYGFTDGGDLFEYDVVSGTQKALTIPNKPSGLSFYGAGSTTCAPVEPPK